MTGGGPLVSAVIPVHNGEAFVAEAIESVLAQTYRALECIVVDDGSTDGTKRVLATFGDRIRYLHRAREGVAAARNAGAAVALGEFLAFLDADDLWEPSKIECQLTVFERRRGLGLVYCGLQLVNRDGRYLTYAPAPEPSAVLRNTLLNEPPFVGLAQTGLLPRRVFLATGGFDERLSTSADSDLVWRIAARFPIEAIPAPLTRYRQHSGQMHLDVDSFAHDSRLILRKAFGSELLPREIRRLKRRALTNRALTLARHNGRGHRLRAVTQLGCALCLSPYRTTLVVSSSLGRRLIRHVHRP